MHRLFVAIRPPGLLRKALLAAMGGVPHARWQTDDQLHLTVRFIGEVERRSAEDIAAVLGTLYQPRFRIALDGVGQFDRKGRLDALWAGVTPHEPLKAFHKKIDRALIRIGIAPETRAYLPHITLARFSRGTAPTAPFGYAARSLTSALVEISEFFLYESELGSEGASYSAAARYVLAQAD